jgi:hypothetical protein
LIGGFKLRAQTLGFRVYLVVCSFPWFHRSSSWLKFIFLVKLPVEPHRKDSLLKDVLRQPQEQRDEVEPGLIICWMLRACSSNVGHVKTITR